MWGISLTKHSHVSASFYLTIPYTLYQLYVGCLKPLKKVNNSAGSGNSRTNNRFRYNNKIWRAVSSMQILKQQQKLYFEWYCIIYSNFRHHFNQLKWMETLPYSNYVEYVITIFKGKLLNSLSLISLTQSKLLEWNMHSLFTTLITSALFIQFPKLLLNGCKSLLLP